MVSQMVHIPLHLFPKIILTRSGSVAPTSPSPPPSTTNSEEAGQPKVVALKQTEVRAWYLQNATYCGYGWVSAVLLVPLLVQDLAAMKGVETGNLNKPCDISKEDFDCVMHVFGNHYLDPGTISLYVSSFSAVVSFVVSLSVAAIADHGVYRKRLLALFAVLGCMTSLSFFMIQSPSFIWLALILSPLGWACYNASSVFTNAFLPIYVRVHPKVLEAQDRVDAHLTLQEMDEKNRDHFQSNHRMSCQLYPYGCSLINPTGTTFTTLVSEQRKIEEQVSNDLSAWCAGAGIIGTVIVQGFCIGISIGMNESLLSLQIAIAFTGVWWFVWTMAVLPWLNPRPGPPLPKDFKTIKAMRQLSQITKFILAWFLLSDGINTVIALLYVITYQELKFSHTESLLMTIALSTVSFVGIYLFLMIRRFWKLSTKFMAMMMLGFYTALTAYFVITPYFSMEYGLRQEWEAWISITYLGLIISTFLGVARVMMAELCPEGEENEWFSLFQMADKGSSWIGPFATGAIQAMTGEFRPGFWFPLALFIVGGALLFTIDMNKGKDEATRYRADQEAKRRLLASIPPITITAAGDSPFMSRRVLLDL
ncbi:Autophagy protein 22 [Linnemannia zychae]|nr:Autophagy protein 22 [Linnemannia zychae]